MTMTSTQAMTTEAGDQHEEAARGDLYRLLATLFYAPPAPELLGLIGAAQEESDSPLQQAWAQLAAVCRQADPEQVRDEYEALFIGTGKPELMLYGSYYLSGFLMEKPLAALRTDLAALGLQRGDSMPESEDHVAALCEVMRYLIAVDDAMQSNIATQKQFFAAHLQPWVGTMCEQIMQHPQARFYPAVANLAKTFFEVERQAFDMA